MHSRGLARPHRPAEPSQHISPRSLSCCWYRQREVRGCRMTRAVFCCRRQDTPSHGTFPLSRPPTMSTTGRNILLRAQRHASTFVAFESLIYQTSSTFSTFSKRCSTPGKSDKAEHIMSGSTPAESAAKVAACAFLWLCLPKMERTDRGNRVTFVERIRKI